MSRNREHRGAAFGGRPFGSVFFVSAHVFSYIMNIYGYSLYIPYIFHISLSLYIYIYIYICPKYVPYVFLCMFRNLFSQQIKISLFNRGGGCSMFFFVIVCG